jgi:hypothetical protein
MTCERCHSLVDEYIDGTLDAADLSEVEAHLAACETCRVMAADLGTIYRSARSLEPRVPPPHVWTKLAASLEAERSRSRFGAASLGFAGRWFAGSVGWRAVTVAATLILLAGSTSWILLRQPSPVEGPTRTPTVSTAPGRNPELAQSVETELKLAEEHYQKAIAGLEQITRAESTTLDPQVAAVLQKNLDVIDHAIGESRAALQTQPTSEVAQESLFEALRNKVALLQDTVVLINEMRKGNPEGTARALSGLNQ